LWGASISHVGFGILLLGVILSSVNQKVLSSTDNGISLAPEQDEKGNLDEKGVKFNRENVILYKNTPLDLGKYEAFYYKREKGINYDSLDEFFYVKFIDKKTKDTFILSPKTQNNPKMGLLAEPSTKHYLSRDIFTHVNYESGLDKKEPFSGFKTEKVVVGGKYTTSSGKCEILPMMLEKVASNKGLALRMRVLVKRLDDTVTLFPQILINESTGSIESISASSEKLGIFLDLQSFNIEDPDPAKQKITFELQSGEKNPVKDYIVLKIIEFPWINLVWAGTIILLIGFIIAVIFRIKTQIALGNN
jgi:cytochrome c-type biogenesis protein CcmF